jgi:hypothetical protein
LKSFAIIVLIFAACAQETPAPEPPAHVAAAVTDDAERTSILELARGATVIDRTGEVLLDFSAARAIDGEPGSFWMNPPHDLPQSMTIALPARSRIDRLGIRTVSNGAFTAGHVAFESSIDGRTFTPVITIKAADSDEPQWSDVKPFEASLIRVTLVDAFLPQHDVRLQSVLARGSELEPPHPGDIAGCWSINGEAAQFVRTGGRVTGVLYTGKEPMHFDGGVDARVVRLNWVRGNDYGTSMLAVSPDGKHLSGLNWHEEAIPLFFDTSWFGDRAPCTSTLAAFDVPMALLRRTGRFQLYDASELPRLLKAIPDAVLVAHEFRFQTAEENRRAAQQALDRLHLPSGIKFVVQGSDAARQQPVTDVMRALYSTVDVEIRR